MQENTISQSEISDAEREKETRQSSLGVRAALRQKKSQQIEEKWKDKKRKEKKENPRYPG